MKEATGELNMTVVTIILIGIILTFFGLFWDSTIKPAIEGQWEESTQNPNNVSMLVE